MRKKLAFGNWKMNKTIKEAASFFDVMLPNLKSKDGNTEVAFFVPFIDIPISIEKVKGASSNANANIMIGAENFYYEEKGAFTGEISLDMLKDAGVNLVLIGHSERRQIFKEDYDLIQKKVEAAIAKDFLITLCCGESLEERENNKTFDIIDSELTSALKNITKDNLKKIIIAYEPIWAIGTGKTATNEEAEEVCAHIRKLIEKLYDKEASDEIHILYGGSVNAQNAKELFNMPNIDGGLVGGASLKDEFIKIVNRD